MRPTLAIYGVQDRSDNGFPDIIHDHSVAYMQDGQLLKFAQLERLTRKKYDNTLHQNIYHILKSEKLVSSDLYDVIFVDSIIGRAFISTGGKIRFEAPLFSEKLTNTHEKGMCWWFDKQINAYVLNHELAHLYSIIPFYGKFKDNSLLVHFDGGASISNFSAWIFKNNHLELVEHQWDLKYLSGLFNSNALNYYILGVDRKHHNSLPGKYMGFASLGHYNPEIEHWLRENNFFENIWKSKHTFFEKARKRFKWNENQLNTHDPFLQDIAATVQHVFTKDLLTKIIGLQSFTQTKYLYYSGGCALNIVTNTKLIESSVFKDVFIPPCPNDAGLSLGAATFMELKKGNQIKHHSPYLNNWNLTSSDFQNKKDILSDLVQKVSDLLIDNKIIGICNGYGEIGPRALGNRSIIALANSKELARKVSMEFKGREWYRPLAPVMLEKNAKLVTGLEKIHHLSQYMLLNFKILPEFQNELQGVVHADNTARIQVIFKREQNLFMHDLLEYLDANYQVKALINTSFNAKDEPMVHTENDAIESARRIGVDILITGKNLMKIG